MELPDTKGSTPLDLSLIHSMPVHNVQVDILMALERTEVHSSALQLRSTGPIIRTYIQRPCNVSHLLKYVCMPNAKCAKTVLASLLEAPGECSLVSICVL